MSKLSDAILNIVPVRFSLKDFELKAAMDSNTVSMQLNDLSMKDHNFITTIFIEEEKKKETLIAEGSINKSKQTMGIKLYADNGKFTLPVCKKRWGLLFSFDTLTMGISGNTLKDA